MDPSKIVLPPDDFLREAGKLALAFSLASSARVRFSGMADSARDESRKRFYKALTADAQQIEDETQNAMYRLADIISS